MLQPPSFLRAVLGLLLGLSLPAFGQEPARSVQLAGPAVPAPGRLSTELLKNAPGDAPVSATATLEWRTLEPPPEARLLDLTAEPEDVWDRIRTGFGMPDLSGPIVEARQNWYATRPALLRTMFDRSKQIGRAHV